MLSESAKFENLGDFNWYTYDGKTKKLAARKHERDLEKGAVFGIKAIRGDKFYIIFPEDFHIDFTVTKRVGLNIIQNSKVKRKPPVIEDNKGAGGRARRSSGVKGTARIQQSQERFSWDATYFKPQVRVGDELKVGIKFENYQWRKLTDITPVRKRNGTKVLHTFAKNDVVGMRYLRDSKGGKLVTVDGKVFALGKEQYDMILNASKVIPKNKWPEGSITLEDMKANAEHEVEAEKAKRNAARAAAKAQREAEKREKRNREREERRRKQDEERAERERLKRRMEGRKKPVEIDLKPKTNQELADMITQGKKPKEDEDVLSDDELLENLDNLKSMDLDGEDLQDFDEDEDLDDDLSDENMPDPEDRPIDSNESEKLMDELDSLIEQRHEETFNLDFDDDESDPDFDGDEDDELEDDEEEDDFEDEDLEDDTDDEDGSGDSGELDEDEDLDEDEEDPEEEDESSDEDDIDTEMAEDALDGDGELDEDAEIADEELGDEPEPEDDLDEDESEEGDGDSPEEEEDPDANPKDYVAEEGDVVVFRSDDSLKREWVLLDIYPLPSNANIDVYKVYNLTDKPESFNTVRVSKGSRNKFENMVKFIRKMNPKEFAGYYQEAEFFDRDPSPINS